MKHSFGTLLLSFVFFFYSIGSSSQVLDLNLPAPEEEYIPARRNNNHGLHPQVLDLNLPAPEAENSPPLNNNHGVIRHGNNNNFGNGNPGNPQAMHGQQDYNAVIAPRQLQGNPGVMPLQFPHGQGYPFGTLPRRPRRYIEEFNARYLEERHRGNVRHPAHNYPTGSVNAENVRGPNSSTDRHPARRTVMDERAAPKNSYSSNQDQNRDHGNH